MNQSTGLSTTLPAYEIVKPERMASLIQIKFGWKNSTPGDVNGLKRGPWIPWNCIHTILCFFRNVHDRESTDFIISPRGITPTRGLVVQSYEYTEKALNCTL